MCSGATKTAEGFIEGPSVTGTSAGLPAARRIGRPFALPSSEEGDTVTRRGLGTVALAAGLTVACAPLTNTEEMVRGALDQGNISDVDVDLDKAANIVRLTGTTDTLADRRRAEELATAIVGTSGRVQNEITVEGLATVGGDASHLTGPDTQGADR